MKDKNKPEKKEIISSNTRLKDMIFGNSLNERKEEKSRITAMAILLAGACFLTYYFHAILGIGTFFTHSFYLPIILAAIWWKRKGFFVAVFLALMLMLSSSGFRHEIHLTNDLLRSLMFVIVSLTTVVLSERNAKGRKALQQSESRIKHLNSSLRAIRNVNQLIAREKDRNKFIQDVCNLLIENRGYHSAWIVLMNQAEKIVTAVEAGLGKNFRPMLERLKRDELTVCCQAALSQPGVLITEDPASTCADCPLSIHYSGKGAMTTRLESHGKTYGILSVTIPKNLLADQEEQKLFKEVSDDIAFALHNMEQENGRKQMEQALRQSEERLQLALEVSRHGLWDWNIQTGEIYTSSTYYTMLGYEPYEIPYSYDTWVNLLHPDDREDTVRIVKESLEVEGKRQNVEFRIKTKSGEWRWMLGKGRVVKRDASGSPLRMIGIHVDITSHKHIEESLQESEQRLESILESFPIATFVLDRDHRVIHWNKAMEELSGVKSEEAINEKKPWKALYAEARTTLADLMVDDRIEEIPRWYPEKSSQSHLTGNASEATDFFSEMGSEGKWLKFTASALRDLKGNIVGAIEAFEDITDRKLAEEALLERSQELERSNQELENLLM